ncbi:DUF2827 domain-containing protein [Luteimonas sp. RC10]|uniref:DUF2827 domain-containing protein n=1 Tax=Luteimonas sp. RC10 TaxID=2587035 RepID=UPI00160D2BAC|nr:DUF2827 domain-containing protein [Luteimonas sp. RC10]MBB3342162.1 hypothetical protein [Luteimonas sp. RC10]
MIESLLGRLTGRRAAYVRDLTDEGVVRTPLRIGITLGLHSADESLWTNGIKQNALYLAKLLLGSPHGHQVLLVNVTDVPITDRLPWDLKQFPTVSFEACRDQLDVLIELGGQIDAAQTQHLKARGTRLVSYCCGFEYIHNAQAILFGRRLWDTIFVNTRYDAVWVIPQVAESTLHFLQTLRRVPATIVPFVWDPMFLEQRTLALPHAGQYRPADGPKRLTVMEPNHDITKFCLYPVLIAEEAWRRVPEAIGHLHVTNAARIAVESPEFIGLMAQLDIVRAGRASFVGRFETPDFLAAHTDVVISHQWANPLNYFYFDVCWQGYALVHNASLCAGLGYYYPGNDVQAGAQQLIEALTRHDLHWDSYRTTQRERIAPYLSTDRALIGAYDALLANLCSTEARP